MTRAERQTVNSYLDYLEGAFLIRRLPPYPDSLKKRLVKSPKVYWRDSGLLHALMNVDSRNDLLLQPWVEASWEWFVIEEILGVLSAAGKRAESFHLWGTRRHSGVSSRRARDRSGATVATAR